MSMRFSIFILIAFSFSQFKAQAQIRHVRGIKSIDATFLKTKFGTGGGLSYVKYFSNSLYGKGSIFYEKGKSVGLEYQSLGGGIDIAKTLFHDRHFFYVNAIGGFIVSVDGVVKGGENLNVSKQLKTGAALGLETEWYLNDHFVFLLNWNQRLLLQQEFGNYRWFASAGIRFNLK